MGHLWQGFDSAQLTAWLHAAGFDAVRYTPLSPDPAAKGPSLFAATARAAVAGGRLPVAGKGAKARARGRAAIITGS